MIIGYKSAASEAWLWSRRWAVLAIAASTALAGCGTATTPAGLRHLGPKPSATSTSIPGSSSTTASPTLCRTQAPQQLRVRLEKMWARRNPRATTQIYPFQTSTDGTHVLAEVRHSNQAGVALVDLATDTARFVQTFPNSVDQAVGTWDGSHAIWIEYLNQAATRFKVWLWSGGGQPKLVGASSPGPGGQYYTQWVWPTLAGKYGAWLQGTGPDGEAKIFEVQLATGKTRVVASGHVANPVFYDRLLIWGRQASKTDKQEVETATDPDTGAPEPVPPALASIEGGYAFEVDKGAIAFLERGSSGAGGKVYYAPTPMTPAHETFEVAGESNGLNWPINLSGNLITAVGQTATASSRVWVIDGRTDSSYFIPKAGGVYADQTHVFFAPPYLAAGGQPGNIAVVPVRKLPRPPRCGG